MQHRRSSGSKSARRTRRDESAATPLPPRARGTLRHALAVAIPVVVVLLAYVWIITAGRMTQWHTYSVYHQKLATAFHHGQTSLLDQPKPELLALPDPYRHPDNEPYRLHDASLYKG